MKDQEIIIVVNIDFRALVHGLTVFNIQGVEMETIFEKFEILFTWIVQVTPSYIADFKAVDHVFPPLFLTESAVPTFE